MNFLNAAAFRFLSDESAALVNWLRRSVVTIQSRRGFGSGVVWNADGLVITNDHVASGNEVEVELWDERRLEGRVIARDPVNDLAAVRIHADALHPATVGDSGRVHVGQLILAVGHPLGIRDNASLGIISAVDCVIRRGRHECSVVHADVDLAPGNSGGPLADMEGRVLGIASMIVSPGIAVAVPSSVVSRFARSLENSKSIV